MADKPKDQALIRLSAAPGRVRRVSAEGLRWIIQEVPAPSFDRRGGKHLVFDAETIIRRVRDYPENWFELSDDELFELTRHLTA